MEPNLLATNVPVRLAKIRLRVAWAMAQWYEHLPPPKHRLRHIPTHDRIGVTEVTYYRWRQEYGGLKSDQVKRLKELETENARLRKAVSDLTLEKLILKEAASGNW